MSRIVPVWMIPRLAPFHSAALPTADRVDSLRPPVSHTDIGSATCAMAETNNSGTSSALIITNSPCRLPPPALSPTGEVPAGVEYSLHVLFRPRTPHVPSIGVQDVDDLVSGGALLIDIREADEWAESRISGAEFKPLSSMNEWWSQLPKDRTIVLYCRSGSRSAHATNVLIKRARYDNVLNMTGGILAWVKAGYAVESG